MRNFIVSRKPNITLLTLKGNYLENFYDISGIEPGETVHVHNVPLRRVNGDSLDIENLPVDLSSIIGFIQSSNYTHDKELVTLGASFGDNDRVNSGDLILVPLLGEELRNRGWDGYPTVPFGTVLDSESSYFVKAFYLIDVDNIKAFHDGSNFSDCCKAETEEELYTALKKLFQ